MPAYTHLTTNTNPKAIRGGYKDFLWFCPIANFATIAAPSALGAVSGDTVAITTAHTFTGDNGFYKWELKKISPTGKGSVVGDPGAKLVQYVYEGIVLGDDASTQEQMEAHLNAKNIYLFRDASCVGSAKYVQLGDDCVQPEFSVEPDFKTTAEGLKEWKFTVTVVGSRYIYSGAVVEDSAE